MSLSIKEIEISDSPFITNLTIQLGYEATTQETEMRLNKILSDDEHCAYAAMDEGKLIGWIHAFYVINLESESFVEIGGMVVDEYSRGKGIGKKLIEKVEGWAIQKKCNRLRVRSNVKRKSAHKFYNRRGFIETKEQKIFDKQIK